MQTIFSHRFLLLFATLMSFCLIFAPASHGIESETVVIVAPGTESVSITLSGVRTVDDLEEPLHGTLAQNTQGFDYFPNTSFWAVGHDVVILESTGGRPEQTHTERILLTAGSLDKETNTVYSANPIPDIVTQPWVAYSPLDNELAIVDGTLYDNAYQMTVEADIPDQPNLTVIDDNAAGNQQTTEHDVDVSVDDLDIRKIPNANNEFSFYQVNQNGQPLVELKAQYNMIDKIWQIRPDAYSGTDLAPIEVDPGFYRVKLVRWGTIAEAGADFYINGQHLGTITGIPPLGLGPITHQLTLDESDEHDGLRMRFEDPKLVIGQNFADGTQRLAYDAFSEGDLSSSTVWDHVEGLQHMSFSNQTVAGVGQQLDIDMGSVDHWEHAYLRQNYVDAPLSSYKARFWMDPSLLNISEGHTLRVVYGCNVSATDYCVDFRLLLTRVNGDLRIRLHTWDDIGGAQVIDAPFSAEPHFVELQYHAGAAPGVPTGWAKLWIDGTQVGVSDRLDNSSKKIQDVRFGSNYTSSTITGVLSLDELETWTED